MKRLKPNPCLCFFPLTLSVFLFLSASHTHTSFLFLGSFISPHSLSALLPLSLLLFSLSLHPCLVGHAGQLVLTGLPGWESTSSLWFANHAQETSPVLAGPERASHLTMHLVRTTTAQGTLRAQNPFSCCLFLSLSLCSLLLSVCLNRNPGTSESTSPS